MSFFKDLFSDIKNHGTPSDKFKNKVVEYTNFVTLQSYRKTGLSDETGFAKADILFKELKEISESLDSKIEFKIYHPEGDFGTSVENSIIACNYLYKQLVDFNFIDYKLLKFAFLKQTNKNDLAGFPIKFKAGIVFNCFINIFCKRDRNFNSDELFIKFLNSESYNFESIISPYAQKAIIFHSIDKVFNFSETLFYQKETDFYDYVISHESSSRDNYVSILNACEEFAHFIKNETESEKFMDVFDLSDDFLQSNTIYLVKEMKIMCRQESKNDFNITLMTKLK